MSPKILLIAIEGAIGVGKSTVVKRLKSFLNGKIGISFVDEPVDEWLQHGFLQGMYDGTITPATFQHMVLQSLAGDLLKTIATEDPVIIISERSAFGNYHVFGKANLTGIDLKMYEFTWKRVLNGMPSVLDTRYIYLESPVETLMERKENRARDGESTIPVEYMKKIVGLHDEWLSQEPNCARIDATKTEEEVFKEVCDVVGKWALEAATHHVANRPSLKDQELAKKNAESKSEYACRALYSLLVQGHQ